MKGVLFKNFYSIEFEQIVLGNLILFNNSWNEIYNFLTIEKFFFKNHKIIFSVILNFLNLNLKFDIFSIIEMVKLNSNFNYSNYLNFLIQKIPNPSNVFLYASIIHNMFILRKILFTMNTFSKNLFKIKNFNLPNLLENIENSIFNINKNYIKEKNKIISISDIFKSYLNNKFNLKNSFFLTGFDNLNKIISGIYRGDLIIIAGRPSSGKTSFSLNIIKYVSEFYNLPVIIFSMEMSINQLFIRLLSLILNEDKEKVVENLNNKNLKIDNFFYNLIGSLKIFIDETTNLNILNIYTKCKYIIKEYGNLGLIIIDYLQLINSFSNYGNNRVFEISEISRSLKCLARELNIPIIAISQLNRNLELRNNKKPLISDLRESGSIEQDADIILLMYRSSIYTENEDNNEKDVVEIIIGKNRNGNIGKISLNFLDERSKFFI